MKMISKGNDSIEWLLEYEVRAIQNMSVNEQIKVLSLIKKVRGDEATAALLSRIKLQPFVRLTKNRNIP